MIFTLKGHLEASLDLLATGDNHLGGKTVSPKESSSCSTAASKHECQTYSLGYKGIIYLGVASEGASVLPHPFQTQIHSPVPKIRVPIHLGDVGLEEEPQVKEKNMQGKKKSKSEFMRFMLSAL